MTNPSFIYISSFRIWRIICCGNT